ncbi:MAG: hypothetical protein KatS3mg105_3896 [Gemmatales bacterium]|nr:MAG: hypothetical protein KatS3mg105_3896 [Gemmatales bacterium]
MSVEMVQLFLDRVERDDQLRRRLQEFQDLSRAERVQRVVQIARTEGFLFTTDEYEIVAQAAKEASNLVGGMVPRKRHTFELASFWLSAAALVGPEE